MTKQNNNKSTTLRGICRLKITEVHDGNKFWLVDQWKNICENNNYHNELLSDKTIIKKIKNGTVKTDWAIKKHEILVNESEFFRIVEQLNPNCVVDDGRGYQFIRDIVEVKVGRNHKLYDPWFTEEAKAADGLGIIYLNGRRFKKIFCSASHVRQKKVFFVAEELYDKVMEIALAGIDVDNPDNIKPACKWGAYLGICCTDSKVVTTPNIVVIQDYKQPITEKFDVVKGNVVKNINKKTKDQIPFLYELNDDPQNDIEKTIPILPFDGAGLVDKSLARTWANDLNLKYIPSAFQFRAMAGIKGNVYPFNIMEFAKKYNVRKIIDRWGKEWDLYDDKINCILTESQVKFAKMFSTAEEWKDAFTKKLYGYQRTFNISDACIPYKKLEPYCVLSYQPLQTLEFSDDEIKTLCQKTVDEVTKVHTDIDAFVKWRGLDRDEEEQKQRTYTNPVLFALKYNHSLANDSYVHKVMMGNLLKFRMTNHIRIEVRGNYQVFIPDIFALAQAAFNLPVTGLLNAGQVYNLFWHNQGTTELDMIRFPHVAREHYLVKLANPTDKKWDEMKYWYQYQNVGYISSIHDSLALRLGGADYDDDHVYGVAEKTICNAVKRNPANTIYFERDKDGEDEVVKKIKADDYVSIAKSDSVGMTNDIGRVVNPTSCLWSMITPENTNEENNKIFDYVKLMSVLDSLTIDFAKTGIKAQMPEKIKQILKEYKNPYFFQFRDKQKTGKDNQTQLRALQNNTKAKANSSDTNSTMNRIAHFMDSKISNLKGDYDVPLFDWKTLLQGDYDKQDSEVYQTVKKELKKLHYDFAKQCKEINKNSKNAFDDDGKDNAKAAMTRLRLIFDECKVQLLQIQPDVNRLINDIIIAYYTEKELVTKSKAIIWNCFSNQMITRCKGKKSKNKIYNIDNLQKQHDKIVKAHKKEMIYKNKQIGIPLIDDIKNKVSITDADKKFINKTLKTQRSKKLYYSLLYTWLKWEKANPDADNMEIMYRSTDQISKSQLCKIAGVSVKAWRDIITSLQNTKLVKILKLDDKSTKIQINYQRNKGKKIELPETCKKMRSWINRNVSTEKHRHEEAENYNVTDFRKPKQSCKKQVICLDTGEIFKSLKDVNRKTSINKNGISACCHGKRKTAGGYHWAFYDDIKKAE